MLCLFVYLTYFTLHLYDFMKNLAINIVNFVFSLVIDDGLFSVQYFPIIALSDWDQIKYFDELNCIWTKCYKFLLFNISGWLLSTNKIATIQQYILLEWTYHASSGLSTSGSVNRSKHCCNVMLLFSVNIQIIINSLL